MRWRRAEAAFNWTTSRRRWNIRNAAQDPPDGGEPTRQGRVSTNVAVTLYRIISCRARPTGLIKLIIVRARMHATEAVSHRCGHVWEGTRVRSAIIARLDGFRTRQAPTEKRARKFPTRELSMFEKPKLSINRISSRVSSDEIRLVSSFSLCRESNCI